MIDRRLCRSYADCRKGMVIVMADMEAKIKRINELYHKSKSEGLTETEKDEQTRLRQEYIASVRGNLRMQLDQIDIVDADGTISNLKERREAAAEINRSTEKKHVRK